MIIDHEYSNKYIYIFRWIALIINFTIERERKFNEQLVQRLECAVANA